MPKISVIVPVYKAEAYLRSCLDSLLSQSFSDFEIFLVDDGSPDNCGNICEEYAGRDSRIQVIHQENRGQAAARNRALEKASGEWICFVDSDDLIHPQMLQRLYDSAVAHHAGVSMCPMIQSAELPDSFYAELSGLTEVLDVNEQMLVALYDREEYPSWVACAKLIRREYVLAHLFCEGRVYEDNEAVCHWVCQSDRLVRLMDPMYFYRTNIGSTTQSGFSRKKLDYLWALEHIMRFYYQKGYHVLKNRFAQKYAWELANCWEGVSYLLQDPQLARRIKKQGRQVSRELDLQFTLEAKERMLQAMHTKLVKLYWPAKGAVRTVRQEGLSGIVRKLRKNRGDGQ